jgi:hypothetical protein
MMNRHLIDTREAAKILGLSYGTLCQDRRRESPRYPFMVMGDGRRIRYDEAVIKEIAERRNSVMKRIGGHDGQEE